MHNISIVNGPMGPDVAGIEIPPPAIPPPASVAAAEARPVPQEIAPAATGEPVVTEVPAAHHRAEAARPTATYTFGICSFRMEVLVEEEIRRDGALVIFVIPARSPVKPDPMRGAEVSVVRPGPSGARSDDLIASGISFESGGRYFLILMDPTSE